MHKRFLAAAIFAVVACVGSPASAGWGCAYDSSAGVGKFWGFGSEQEARDVAMNACTSRRFQRCRIIGCSANVDSEDDADRLWSSPPGQQDVPCGGAGQEKC